MGDILIDKYFKGSTIYIFVIILFFNGLLFAQYTLADSIKIQITISSCPMQFEIDSLPRNPNVGGMPVQDTFWMWWEYEGFHDTELMKLKWETMYLVGSRIRDVGGVPIDPPQMQAILVVNTGCPPLDFELSTYARSLPDTAIPDSSWWEPNDTNSIERSDDRGKYVLQALATGYGTPSLMWADSVRFKTSAAYYWVVKDTFHPQAIKDSVLAGGDIGYFYSEDHLGFDEIPTIDAHGVNITKFIEESPDTANSVFFLHMALTTPSLMTSLTDSEQLKGYIILVVRARVRGE